LDFSEYFTYNSIKGYNNKACTLKRKTDDAYEIKLDFEYKDIPEVHATAIDGAFI